MRENGLLHGDRILSFAQQAAFCRKKGHEIVLVSSGALATGKSLTRDKSEGLGEAALASFGQAELIHLYNAGLREHGVLASQLLLTRRNFEDEDEYNNIVDMLEQLLQYGNIVPVLNENDPLTGFDNNFTDNDQLAGIVAAQIGADRLILLTSAEGVYDRDPCQPGAKLIRVLEDTTQLGTDFAGAATQSGRGGIQSKVWTAQTAAMFGIAAHIASGEMERILLRMIMGKEYFGTYIPPVQQPIPCFEARKRQIRQRFLQTNAM